MGDDFLKQVARVGTKINAGDLEDYRVFKD
jgi:hypothetical protein